jgi:hypothetical protein
VLLALFGVKVVSDLREVVMIVADARSLMREGANHRLLFSSILRKMP